MIQEFVEAWNQNKGFLRAYMQEYKMGEYQEYRDLVELLFRWVINPYLESKGLDLYDCDKIHEINDGEYQGTLIFLIPIKTYQPSPWQYVITHQYYGSCSGCDTLQGIHGYDYDSIPSSEQVDEYMELCLGLLQHCKIPFELGED